MLNKISELMGKDHDRLDALFRSFQESRKDNPDKCRGFFHQFKTGLQRHIIWEEDILFPIFEAKTGMVDRGPTAMMRIEHHQIKELLDKIHGHVVTNSQDKRLDDELLEILASHNDKEEGVLYPWLDSEVNRSDFQAILKKMEEIPAKRYNHCC